MFEVVGENENTSKVLYKHKKKVLRYCTKVNTAPISYFPPQASLNQNVSPTVGLQ